MIDDIKFSLKQNFEIKCVIDLIIFIAIMALFTLFSMKYAGKTNEWLVLISVCFIIYLPVYIFTKQWILRCIKKSVQLQSDSLSKATSGTLDILKSQKKIVEDLVINSNNITNLTEKLKNISAETVITSENTEKQISQSILFSEKEHDAITSNSERMVGLRQKVQIISELILELSEHTQQISNSISVVDDIAEQTNMLALNAAVEAARAGEHGKGFAVVAGEIRKLADESKQAITKIASLTGNIQTTTNSTVMATEEGSKEIEYVVKDIDNLSSVSETLKSLIANVSEFLTVINQNTAKQNDAIEKLNTIGAENKAISDNLISAINSNAEKINKLNDLSNIIRNSATEV